MKTKKDVKALVSAMTLEEKAAMCSGYDFWHTAGVERLGIPQSMVSDGPHGLRKQAGKADHLGLNEAVKAICFPAGCATAASFNPELIEEMGKVLGNECQAEDISVLLGPAMNIKRSPLCGRNFEYYSEDPLVAGKMASALVRGIQSEGVGACIKHYLANSQEKYRMTCSSEVDERTLREIYMPAFEIAVKEADPWTVMCSYNKINGVYAAESRKYLTEVLRDEWGFNGYVMSDWGACNDRVPDLEAGLDLEMPASGGATTAEIIAAVKDGKLEESVVDTACERILSVVYSYEENRDKDAVFDREKDHQAAERIAEETVVLLKNEGGVLPLSKSSKTVFIGKYAASPRYQGGGSSHINSYRVTSALEKAGVPYAQGFQDGTGETDEALLSEALELAKGAEAAVIFAGLPDSFESEGYDRSHLRLPACQEELIRRVSEVQENVVVVLHNGSPVEMPWAGSVKGILEAYLGGEGVGAAVAKVLYGEVNPSGKLPETFPKRLEDTPCYLCYGGDGSTVEYREGVFVGYRYYDSKDIDVLFPFGHGLSYTTFSYSPIKADKESMLDTETLTLSLEVTNTGSMAGKEVVQLYVGRPEGGKVMRPVKELRAFDKVSLEPGETKRVTFTLSSRDFSYWNETAGRFIAPTGTYKLLAGSSSRDIRSTGEVTVQCTASVRKPVSLDTAIGEIEDWPEAMALLSGPVTRLMKAFGVGEAQDESSAMTDEMGSAMVRYMPLRNLIGFAGEPKESLLKTVREINSLL